MSDATESVSDAELAWQKSFVFDRHETAAIYKRKVTIEVDTAIWQDFASALADEASTANLRKQSEKVDNSRYCLTAELHECEGKLALYLSVSEGTLGKQSLPRVVAARLCVHVPGRSEAFASRRFGWTFTKYNGYGYKSFLDLADLRHDAHFKLIMPKRLILKAEIEEYLSSERADFLPSPKFSLSSTILDLYNFSSLPTDTFITLSDGQVSTYSDMLKSKCTHFRAVFSGDFCEGTRSVSANVAPTHLDDGSLDESLDQDPEPVADYDSDFDNRASSSQSSVSDNHKRDYKVVNLPNFSKATFSAFMLYLSTESISFKPIKSAPSTYQLPNDVSMRSINSKICLCSPKSMYVMADYFDVPALKDICKSAFIAMIHPGNVLQELAHRFGRLHQPILEALEAYAVEHWPQVTATASFDEDMQKLMDYEESRKTFARILKKASQT